MAAPADDTSVVLLKAAVASLSAVVVFLFFRLEQANQRLYNDAREDAATDKEIADALKAIADSQNNGSRATTTNSGGNGVNRETSTNG